MPVNCITVTVGPLTDLIWHIKLDGSQYVVRFRDTRSGDPCWSNMGWYSTYNAALAAGQLTGYTKVADNYSEVC